MTIKTIITGKAFALVRFGKSSACLMKHLVSNRSCWLTDDDAAAFYRDLGTSGEHSVDNLLSALWVDRGYGSTSWSDAIA